jgi:MFS family permease
VLLFSIAKIATSIFEVPTGTLSDRAGRKLTLLLGQLASVLSIALYALGQDFTVLAAGAVLEGLAFSFFSGNNEALLYDTLKSEGAEDDYAHWQGRVSSMFQAALAVSAGVATIALIWLPLRAMFVLSLVPQIAGLGIGLFLIEPPRPARTIPTNIFSHLREALAGFFRDVRLRDLSLAAMLGYGIGEAKHMFYPAFVALLWPSWALGIAGLLTHAFGAIGFRAAGRLIARFRELTVLVWCNVASSVLGLTAVGIPTVASPAIGTVASLAFGPGVTAQGSLMQKAFSDAQRATMASLISLGGNILFAIAVFALGAWADRVGPRYALLTAEILSIPVTLLYWRLYRAVRTDTP